MCERLFGTGNTQFIHNLAGNTKVMRNVRQVTKSVNPKGLACWTLGMFYESFLAYAYEQYDTADHPALGDSPRAAFTRGLELGGERAHLFVPYDETFRMLMLPTTPKGKAKVQPGNGVKINYNYYWTDEFRNPDVENTRVPVRYDPFNSGTAWAWVGKRWLKCTSGYWQAFRGHSEKEIMLATAQLRKLRQRHSGRAVISARVLADFLGSVEARELLLPQRAKDAALGEVMAVIEGHPAPVPIGPASGPGPEPRPRRGRNRHHRVDLGGCHRPGQPAGLRGFLTRHDHDGSGHDGVPTRTAFPARSGHAGNTSGTTRFPTRGYRRFARSFCRPFSTRGIPPSFSSRVRPAWARRR